MQKMSNEKFIDMGRRIRTFRKHKKMTLKEMSRKLGIAIGYLSDIEHGNANPGPLFFLGLVEKFNVNLDYIFLGQGAMFYPLDKIQNIDTYADETFNFKGGLDSPGKLLWLMEHSTLFKYNILGYAEQYLLSHEDIIKKSVIRYLDEKKEEIDKATNPRGKGPGGG